MAGGYGWSHSEDQLLASLNARSFKNFPAPIGLETAPGLHTLDSVCRVQCNSGNPSSRRADNIGVFGNLVTSLLQLAANAVEGSFRTNGQFFGSEAGPEFPRVCVFGLGVGVVEPRLK